MSNTNNGHTVRLLLFADLPTTTQSAAKRDVQLLYHKLGGKKKGAKPGTLSTGKPTLGICISFRENEIC